MVPIKNTSMLKSAKWPLKNSPTSVYPVFHIYFTWVPFSFYSLLRVGVVMSVNAPLSIFLLKET